MEINWKVDSIRCLKEVDQYTDVVYEVAWRVFASKGTYSADAYGSAYLLFEESDNFIPYEDLTEEDVLEWVFNSMGEGRKTEIENSVTNDLNNLIQPKFVANPLPWASE